MKKDFLSPASPTYNLSRDLKDWFKNMTDFTPRFSMKNFYDLVQKLSSASSPPPSSSKLFSFDIAGMFTNIHVETSINYMRELLHKSNVPATSFLSSEP